MTSSLAAQWWYSARSRISCEPTRSAEGLTGGWERCNGMAELAVRERGPFPCRSRMGSGVGMALDGTACIEFEWSRCSTGKPALRSRLWMIHVPSPPAVKSRGPRCMRAVSTRDEVGCGCVGVWVCGCVGVCV